MQYTNLYTHIYGGKPAQNVQKRCPRVCYDKNACKRAQERCLTRPGDGEPSLLLRVPVSKYRIYTVYTAQFV